MLIAFINPHNGPAMSIPKYIRSSVISQRRMIIPATTLAAINASVNDKKYPKTCRRDLLNVE